MQSYPLPSAATAHPTGSPARYNAFSPAAIKARAKAIKKARKKEVKQEQQRVFISWCSCFHALGFSF